MFIAILKFFKQIWNLNDLRWKHLKLSLYPLVLLVKGLYFNTRVSLNLSFNAWSTMSGYLKPCMGGTIGTCQSEN